jgi:hypothetical protein
MKFSFIKIFALMFLASCDNKFDNRSLIPEGILYGDLIYSNSDFNLECNIQVFELKQDFIQKMNELGTVYLDQYLDGHLNYHPDFRKGFIVYEPWRIATKPSYIATDNLYSIGDRSREDRIRSVFDCLENAEQKIRNSFFPSKQTNREEPDIIGYFTFSTRGPYSEYYIQVSDMNLVYISSNGFLMVSRYN